MNDLLTDSKSTGAGANSDKSARAGDEIDMVTFAWRTGRIEQSAKTGTAVNGIGQRIQSALAVRTQSVTKQEVNLLTM